VRRPASLRATARRAAAPVLVCESSSKARSARCAHRTARSGKTTHRGNCSEKRTLGSLRSTRSVLLGKSRRK
jgi:hypothetical protein